MISFLLFFYIWQLLSGVMNNINNNMIENVFHILHLIAFIYLLIMIFIFIFKKDNILYPSIFIKIIIFISLFLLYFIIEQTIIKLSLYSIGDSGGWLRHHIYNDIDYIFQWYEVLFWNFIFSLHYPLYIFIFFKPFVNHLDKSIKKIKEHEK